MKKTKKYYQKLAGILFLLGSVFCLSAFIMVDYDVKKLSSSQPYEKKEYHQELANIEEIFVDTTFDNIELLPSKDDQFHLTYYENDVTIYGISNTNTHLRIEKEDHRKFYQYFMSIDIGREDTLVMEIPTSYQNAISIHTTNGTIQLQDVATLTKLELDTTFGDIKVGQIDEVEELQLTTTNGDIRIEDILIHMDCLLTTTFGEIELENITSEGNISVTSSNEDISLRHVVADKKMDVETSFGNIDVATSKADITTLSTTNGNVVIQDAFVSEKITIRSTFGAIEFKDIKADQIDLQTSNDDIRGNILGKQAEYTIDSKASNGNTTLLNREGSTEKTIRAYTSFGDCAITFSEE